MSKEVAKKIIAKLRKLKSERGNFETHWQDIADLVLPKKNDITVRQFPGVKRNLQVYDSTAIHANELLSGALHGLLTNPSTQFFELTTGFLELDDDDEVRLWLQKVTRQMHEVLNNSNFQTEIHEVYQDQTTFGTATLFMEEDDERIIRFMSRPIQEIFIDENSKGQVDTIIRSFDWDLRKLVQKFGEKKILEAFNAPELKQIKDKQHKIIHAVMPRADAERAKIGAKSFAFASLWVLEGREFVLDEGGFRVFPAAVPRWTKISGERYGRSPSMKALPDIRMMNSMKLSTIKGAQKTIDPPILVPDDGFLNPPNMRPGGLNFFRAGSGEKMEAFTTNSRIDFGIQLIDQVRNSIREAYFIDQLQLAQGPQMTATEVIQRTEQAMRLLGPVLGRQQNELLRPMIDRLFDIMERKGLLPDPIPEALQGRDIRVQYSSLISRAQRSSEVQNILRTIEASAPFIQADPAVMDNFDGDVAARIISRQFAMQQEIVRPKAEVEEIRKRRAQAQQAAAEAEAEAQGAQNAALVGQAIGQSGINE